MSSREHCKARHNTKSQGGTGQWTQHPESFDVFLSHNSNDKPAVCELGLALRVRGLKVWLDEWELIPGRRWVDAVEEAIETTGCAAVLVAGDGFGPWQIPEMRALLAEFVSRGLPVIPVLLPGAPEKPTLPLFLRQFTWVDLRSGISPEGLDRLQWGITGTKPAGSQSIEVVERCGAKPLSSRGRGVGGGTAGHLTPGPSPISLPPPAGRGGTLG
jgi:hypothetical protein